MSNINIFSPKLMLTEQTFDTCIIIQFRSRLPTEYLVDKMAQSVHRYLVVYEYFCPSSVYVVVKSESWTKLRVGQN